MAFCKVGPQFPLWLQTQNQLQYFNMSNSKISGVLPEWMWDFSSILEVVDISKNALRGNVPNARNSPFLLMVDLHDNQFKGSLPFFNSSLLEALILSKNSFSGSIWTSNIEEMMPQLMQLSIASNNLSGQIPTSLCKLQNLKILDLSENQITGELPGCLMNRVDILLLKNNAIDKLPILSSSPCNLRYLHLARNKLNGLLPRILENCTRMETLDAAHNMLTGSVPTWIAETMRSLRILRLRSNLFTGNLPPQLSNLPFLQFLYLGNNSISGEIPESFGYFFSMKSSSIPDDKFLFQIYGDFYSYTVDYTENVLVITKQREMLYGKSLKYLTSIDLSENQLYGNIPVELGKLTNLVNLNLSRNHLSGGISGMISELRMLESLDLSKNSLSGEIPPSLSTMTYLSHLNLSFNKLSGRIPTGGQLDTFTDPSIYMGNLDLCGVPLNTCPNRGNPLGSQDRRGNKFEFDTLWFYIGSSLGFIAGFWTVYGTLMANKAWRHTYFHLVDSLNDKLYVLIVLHLNKYRSKNVT